jgi:hypothetical protein
VLSPSVLFPRRCPTVDLETLLQPRGIAVADCSSPDSSEMPGGRCVVAPPGCALCGESSYGNVARMVDDVISLVKGSLELWPTLIEICYFHKNRKPFPITHVKNKQRT